SKYLMPDAIALFEEVCDKNKGIRRIGISFGDLYPESSESYNLLIDLEEVEKERSLRDSLLKISNKFGNNSVLKAHDYMPNATQRTRNKLVGGHYGGDEE
nr:DNA repair protein [Bacilli bacterium]